MRPLGITLLLIEAVLGGAGAHAYENVRESAEFCAPEFAPTVQLPVEDLARVPDPQSNCITKKDVSRLIDGNYKPHRAIDGVVLADKVSCWAAKKLGFEKDSDGEWKKRASLWKTQIPKNLGVHYLSNGIPIPFSGDKEAATSLKKWIDGQKYFSVNPEDLFRQAATITKDPQKALMLCWNVLSENWNANVVERNLRYRSLKMMRLTGEISKLQTVMPEQRELRAKLTDARETRRSLERAVREYEADGEILEEYNKALKDEQEIESQVSNWRVSNRGDDFSGWYHFFGSAIHAFAKEADDEGKYLPTSWLLFAEKSLYGSHGFGDSKRIFDYDKRDLIDRAGIDFGNRLAKNLAEPDSIDEIKKLYKSNCDLTQNDYIKDQPEKLPKNWALRSDQLAQDYGEKTYSHKYLSNIEKVLVTIHLKREGNYEKYRCYTRELTRKFVARSKSSVLLDAEDNSMMSAVIDTFRRDGSAEAKDTLARMIFALKGRNQEHCERAISIYLDQFAKGNTPYGNISSKKDCF